jgi:MFS family permease
MFDRLRRSWELGKASWSIMTSNPQLLLFPLIATVALLISSAAIGGIGWGVIYALGFDLSTELSADNIPGIVVVVLISLVGSIVTIYFNTALTGAVLRQIDGHSATLSDGLAVANSRKQAIVGWALMMTTVGLLLAVIRDKGGVAGRVVAWIGDIAWTLATFFVVPILATHDIGPIDALKESGRLFKRTWGEQVVGNAGIGLFAFIIGLPLVIVAFIVAGIGFATGSIPVIVVTLIIAGLLIGLTVAIGSTLSGIYRTVLYRWATTGETVPGYPQEAVRASFVPKGGMI